MIGRKPVYSSFGRRFTRRTGALELMADLGAALSAPGPVHMLGGGNPARIPRMEQVFRGELARIAGDPEAFARMAEQYAPPEGDIGFRSVVAASLEERFGWPLTYRNIALTAGSQTAFFLLFNLFGGRSAEGRRRILLPMTPEYVGYADLGLEEGLFSSTRPAIGLRKPPFYKYHVDFDRLPLDDDTAAICISRPTNPTGNVLDGEEVARLDAIARARGIPLIIDCAYGLPFPAIQFVETAPVWNENVVLCLSLSKVGLPGLRTGIVVAREEVIEALAAMTAVASLAPNNAGALIAERLIASGELLALCDSVIRPYYRERMEQAVEWLSEACDGLPLRLHEPEGAFFLWLWFEGLPIGSEELYRRLKSRGVFVLSGHHFFPGLDAEWPHRHECLRVSYAQEPWMVSQGIRLIADEVRRAYDRAG